jgi:hypothetical protein
VLELANQNSRECIDVGNIEYGLNEVDAGLLSGSYANGTLSKLSGLILNGFRADCLYKPVIAILAEEINTLPLA